MNRKPIYFGRGHVRQGLLWPEHTSLSLSVGRRSFKEGHAAVSQHICWDSSRGHNERQTDKAAKRLPRNPPEPRAGRRAATQSARRCSAWRARSPAGPWAPIHVSKKNARTERASERAVRKVRGGGRGEYGGERKVSNFRSPTWRSLSFLYSRRDYRIVLGVVKK